MTGVTADSADDAGCKVLSLGAVVFAVADLTTVLTSLVLVISKRTVERRKFTELVALQLVLAFGDGSSLSSRVSHDGVENGLGGGTYSLNDIMNELLGLVDLVFGIGHDQAVEVFFLVAGVGGIRPTLTLFDGALSTDSNFGARVFFHCLECVATRANK